MKTLLRALGGLLIAPLMAVYYLGDLYDRTLRTHRRARRAIAARRKR